MDDTDNDIIEAANAAAETSDAGLTLTPEQKLIQSLIEKNIHQFAARDVAVQVLHNSAFALLQTAYNALITEYTVAKYELHTEDVTEGLTASNEWALETINAMIQTVYAFKQESIPEVFGEADTDDIDWSQA